MTEERRVRFGKVLPNPGDSAGARGKIENAGLAGDFAGKPISCEEINPADGENTRNIYVRVLSIPKGHTEDLFNSRARGFICSRVIRVHPAVRAFSQ